MANLKKALAVVMAAATAFTFAPVAQVGSTVAQAEETKDQTKVTYKAGATEYEAKSDTELTDGKKNTTLKLDTVSNKTAQISVANTSAAIYYNAPSDTSVISVNTTTGLVTALKKGDSSVKVTVGKTAYTVPFTVDDVATDVVKALVNGKETTNVSLDLSTSTAQNAVKSLKITGSSSNGLPVKYNLYKDADAKDSSIVSGNSDDILTLASDGTITAGKTAGIRYVKVYTETDNGKKINGNSVIVKVNVQNTPEAIITVPSEIKLDFKNSKSVDLSKLVTVNDKKATIQYRLYAADTTENAGAAQVVGTNLNAVQVGNATLEVKTTGSTDTRETIATIPVSVVNEIVAPAKVTPTITADTFARLTVGETKKVSAETTATGAAITYAIDNPAVATVDAQGNVTAVGAGTAVLTITSGETKEALAGTKQVTVIVDAKQIAPVKLAKVSGVKVTGRKKNSTKINVKWTRQSGEGIYYRVEKTIVKKVKGKTVKTKAYKYVKNGKNTTTLKIAKTDTVKVRVRAVVDEADGTKRVASWSKATTSKRPAK